MEPSGAAKSKAPRWKPLKIQTGQVTLSGGCSNKPFVLETIELAVPGGAQQLFVRVNKNHDWFLKVVGGTDMKKGALRSVNVLDDMRKRAGVDTAVAGFDSADAGQAVGTAVADAADACEPLDPMDALDLGADELLQTPNKKTRTPRRALPLKSAIVEVEMPLKPKCADASCTQTRMVNIYLAGATKKELWVAHDALEWLLLYAADQLRFQGVECDEDADACTKDANCPAVAELNIEWDFQNNTWQSEFVGGPCQGIKRSFSASQHTEGRWEKMGRSSLSTADVAFAEATPQVKKQTAKEFLVSWCDAISRGEQESFEHEFRIGDLKPSASTSG